MPPPILIIVESPNKTKKIEEMFPGRFKAMATYGHICDLPSNPQDGGIGIDRNSMEGQYALTQDSKRYIDGKRTIAKLQKYLKDNPGTTVYLGTDDDREGESIAAFTQQYLKLKNPKRMLFNAITKEKIERAFQTAGHIDWNAVASRESRRLIDRIIGYTVSPVLREIIKEKGTAAGRVQTAVEALVIERERKIRAHKALPYYTVHFDFGGWQATWQVPQEQNKRTGPKANSEYDIDDTTPRCYDEAAAREIAGRSTLVVELCVESIESRLPPSPLYTISMIQAANRIFGWDAEKTMQIAQKLFEGDNSGHGHITYHRTDSPNIDPIAAAEIRTWLQEKDLPIPETPNTWASKNKQAQEGHEAIRPSYLEIEEAGATDEQRALYKLIRERAIYSQLAPAQYSTKRIVLTDTIHRTQKFTATARTLADPGWLATPAAKTPALKEDDENADETLNTAILPKLTPGALINIRGAEVKSHTTKAPPRYTMNTLTSKLEKLSIGRPATIATLLKNVQTKGTITLRKDKKLEATPFGEKCYDVLYPRFLFANIGYTAELEQALDKIASGTLDSKALARAVWDRLDADCEALLR